MTNPMVSDELIFAVTLANIIMRTIGIILMCVLFIVCHRVYNEVWLTRELTSYVKFRQPSPPPAFGSGSR